MFRSSARAGGGVTQPRRGVSRTAALATVLCIAACTSTRPTIEPPTVTLDSVRILRIADGEASLILTLRLVNPNKFDFVAKAVDFDVTLDGRPTASIHSVHLDPLPAGGEAKVELAGRVGVGAVAAALMTLGSRLPVAYVVNGIVTLPDGTALPFSQKGDIPVAHFDRVLGARP